MYGEADEQDSVSRGTLHDARVWESAHRQLNGVPMEEFVAGIYAEITTRDRNLTLVPSE